MCKLVQSALEISYFDVIFNHKVAGSVNVMDCKNMFVCIASLCFSSKNDVFPTRK